MLDSGVDTASLAQLKDGAPVPGVGQGGVLAALAREAIAQVRELLLTGSASGLDRVAALRDQLFAEL